MARYNFTSPWASAGSALEELLIRKKAEERQQLLDEITKRRAESEMQTDVLQRDTMTQNLALGKERDARERAALYAGQLKRGDDPAVRFVNNPEAMDLLKRFGYLERAPRPGVSTTIDIPSQGVGEPGQVVSDIGFQPQVEQASIPSPEWAFTGTPVERQTAENLKAVSDLSSMFEDPNKSPISKIAAYRGALQAGEPSPALERLMSERQAVSLDADTKRVTPLTYGDNKPVMSGTDVHTIGFRPREFAPSTKAPYEDKEGNLWTFDTKAGTWTLSQKGPKSPRRLATGQEPPAGYRPGQPVINEATARELKKLRSDWETNQSDKNWNAAMAAFQNAISGANVIDPTVREAAMAALFDTAGTYIGKNHKSAAQMAEDQTYEGPPEQVKLEKSQFIQIIRTVRGY